MKVKSACIVVDLRRGDDVVKIPNLIAVLDAAGWKTDISLKEYGGETLKLAEQAAKDGYDLVIGYGGDGTLNDAVNGVMYAGGKSIVGDIPGGTFNEWAGTIELSDNAVKAALSLVNSEARKVDLGHVEVEGLTLPNSQISKKPKHPQKTRQYFLLHVGLGIDAAIMAHISKPLKYESGKLAFDLSAAKELPEQRPFPVEVQAIDDSGQVGMRWKGEAFEVVVSKTRFYAGVVDIAPDAHIDDGLLNVCIFTTGGAITTVEQAASLLFRHKPDSNTAQYFRGAHLLISIPANIGMQIDGSVVRLDDYLHKSEREALEEASNPKDVMVNYRFDAEPGALQMAIPRTYHGALFEESTSQGTSQQPAQNTPQQATNRPQGVIQELPKLIQALQAHGRKVKVIGAAPNPDKNDTYIIAGTYTEANTDETRPVGVVVDAKTTILNAKGEQVSPADVQELQEGATVVVEGNNNKQGVIQASSLMMT